MNKKRVMTCLAVGVCVLAVSATAALGSVSGYANYKTAVKTLALETDNVSASGTFDVTYDGQNVLRGQVEIACDGANQSSHVITTNGTEQSESWYTTLDGVNTWFDSDDTHYYTSEAESNKTGHGLLNVSDDDEFSARLVNFLELGADTVMGDLKNNVIEIDAKDGIYTYQLDISNSQVPALVNSGLSVLAYAASDSFAHTQYVDFEDWDLCAIQYYEEQTGQTLSDDFLAHYRGEIQDDSWFEDNAELDRFDELQSEMHEHYYEILNQKMEEANQESGVLYVAKDGSSTFYSDVLSYQRDHSDGTVDDLESFFGEDLTLDNVHFTFSVNDDSQLIDNHCEATFTTVDMNGVSHTLVITGDVNFFDYGTTTIQPLDVGDRTTYEPTAEFAG